MFKSVRKRNGTIVPFDQNRITQAIFKAMAAAKEGGPKDAQKASDKLAKELAKRYSPERVLGIEEIQDAVEETLIILDYAKTAKAYILYRRERAALREKRREIPEHVKKLATESKKYFQNPLAEFVYYRSYSRWIEEEGRRETWVETVKRYTDFMKEKLGGKLTGDEYKEIHEAILKQEVMPSMRLMWSAGKVARLTNVAGYNCSFIGPSKLRDFGEIMYLLMCGAGVGFSVEQQNVQKLPQIKKQRANKKIPTHIVEDSREGWADALVIGLETWFGGKDIKFDYSKVRPAGARLKTMGGKSSGPGPLRELLDFTKKNFLANQNRRLKPIDVHDIICKIGEIVVAGGVRRAALISLSDLDDEDMRSAKTGQFYLTEPQRSMANNSVAYNEKPSAAEFLDEWIALAKSGTGERGIFNRGDLKKQLPERRWKIFEKDWATSGVNPCVTGDTLVYVADGRGNVPIKQLADEGKDIPVFCLDNKDRMAIRYMRHPRITGKNIPVYKITLDDGSTIRTTSSHKFRLKSDVYKEIKDLRPGDSLYTLTKFEASIKDVFSETNSRSQNYWWINNGWSSNVAEHRAIAAFYYNTSVPRGYIVHHRDRNSQNNDPDNLEIITKREHDRLHGNSMTGNNNPMRRAKFEWSNEEWRAYRLKHSENNRGDKNKNFSGITDEELKGHAVALTKRLGRRFSSKDWLTYAKQYGLPQHFSKWRQDHLGGIMGLAKWAAHKLGLSYIDADPRSTEAYKKYSADGYNCEIMGGRLLIVKNCEVCGKEFKTVPLRREYGMCSISCGLKRAWSDPDLKTKFIQRINKAHRERKEKRREAQTKIYSDLKFELGRDPSKKEWTKACKENSVSCEIARVSSPFRRYKKLKEFAETYNHKVISVKFCGYEDVYNGTVDEFHNFFVGGFSSITKNNKRKFVYLNNPQCGEILLKNKSFCNLSEVAARSEDTEESLLKKIRIAAILGTYQSTLTNFPYLSKEWKKHCEEERLLGVSITGQWDCPAVRHSKTLRRLKDRVIEINKEYAKRFGIGQSAAVTAVKPSGTVSLLVNAASGMHPRHARYYIRRVRISATDSLFKMLRDQKIPYYSEVGQKDGEATTYVLEFPVKAPEGAVLRNDLTALEQLEYWKLVKENYTEHNPSTTILVGDDEWIAVANWLYENWEIIGGLSFLPRSEHVYELAPYEEITEEQYNKIAAEYPDIDFSQILLYEKEDETGGAKEAACVAGICEI